MGAGRMGISAACVAMLASSPCVVSGRERGVGGLARGSWGALRAQVEAQPTSGSAASRAGIVALSQHAGSGVWTMTLEGGVRVHYREMPGGLSISICVWGDGVRRVEPAVLRALGDALDDPERLGEDTVVEEDRRVRVSAWATGESLRIEIDGRGVDGEAMFDAAARLLDGACLNEERAAELIERQRTRKDREERSAGAALQREAWRALRGDENVQIEAGEVCEAWGRILAGARIDVGVAGDLARGRAMELASAAFVRAKGVEAAGGVMARGEIGKERGAREIEAIEIERREGGFGGRGVLVGLMAPGAEMDIGEVRALRLAADVLEDRLAARIGRGEVGARYEPRAGMDGRRMLYGVAIDAGDGDIVAIREEIERLVREGAGDEEIARAGEARGERARELLERTGYWAGVLSERSRLAIELDEIVGAPRAYRRIDAQAVRSATAKLAALGTAIRIVVIGEGGGGGER